MELLLLAVLATGGIVLYRASALAAPAAPVSVPGSGAEGFLDIDIPFIGGELEERIEEFFEEELIAPAVEVVEAVIESGALMGALGLGDDGPTFVEAGLIPEGEPLTVSGFISLLTSPPVAQTVEEPVLSVVEPVPLTEAETQAQWLEEAQAEIVAGTWEVPFWLQGAF